jgi:hypothetical protein
MNDLDVQKEQELLSKIYREEHTKQHPESEITEAVIDIFKTIDVECKKEEIEFIQFPKMKGLPLFYTSLENSYLEGYSKYAHLLPKERLGELKDKKEKMDVVLKSFKKFFGLCVKDGKVYVIKNPTKLNIENNNLSSLTEPAIQFFDENEKVYYSAYYYQGISLEPWMINTPISELTKEKLFSATEDQQRAMLARMTPTEMIKFLDAKELESAFGYTLLSMKYSNYLDAKFVKMTNPSTSDLHIEAVPENTTNLLDAMLFREGIRAFPKTVDSIVVDSNSNYEKQGDVVIVKIDSVPSGAVKVDRKCVSETDLIRHTISGEFELCDSGEENVSYLVSKNCQLNHPQHNTVYIKEGVFKLSKTQVWDYVKNMKRPVID